MKIIFTILTLSLLLTACSRQDANFSKQIVGTWQANGDVEMFNADGSFLVTTSNSDHTNDYAGTWQIKSGVMTVTPTNVSGPEPEVQVGDTMLFKIIRIDAHHLSYEINGQTISCNR